MPDFRLRFALPFALLAAILAISISSVLIRFAQQEAPSLVIAALRLTFAALLLAPLVWTRHRDELRSLSRTQLALGCIAGLFLAVHFAAWTSSLEFTSVASSVVFVSTGPLWVALLSPAMLGERLRRASIFGLMLAILGGILIGLWDACARERGLPCRSSGLILQGDPMWGNFLALVGAWAVSGYLIIGRRLRASRSVSLIPYIFLVYSLAALVLIVMMFAAGDSPWGYPPQTYGWIVLLAVFPQLIGHSTYNWVLRYIPATLVALVTLVEPIGSAVLAYFVLHEAPTEGVLIGGSLILLGISLSTRQGKSGGQPDRPFDSE